MILKSSRNTVLYIAGIVFILCLAEMFIFSDTNLYKSGFLTWVYFLSGVIIGILPLFQYQKTTLNVHTEYTNTVKKVFLYLGYVYFFVLTYKFVLATETYRLDFREADMLPSIEMLAKRWLSGQEVYTPLTEINRPEVLYGPGFWLPYIIPILLKIDIRWTSFVFFMLGIVFMYYQADKRKLNPIFQVLIYILIFLVPYFYIVIIWSDIRFTQEPLIVGYYLLLGYFLLQNKNKYQWIWVGLMIGLCLLSRFSFLLWIPFYIAYLWKNEGIKKAIQVSSVIGLLVLMLFLVPFGIDGIKKFATLPSFQAHQMADRFADYPRDSYLGMAKFFSSKDGWFIYNLQRGFSVFIMILGIITVLFSPKWIDKNFLPLGFLKLTLVFFANFLQIPYPYLFGPSTFLSVIIVIAFVQQKIDWVEVRTTTKFKLTNLSKSIQLLLVLLPILIYSIIESNYFKESRSLYEKNAILAYEQPLNTLSEEQYWIKTIPIDSTIAHTGKYSNKVGFNSSHSCTFNIPLQEILSKQCNNIRFSAWVKSGQHQLEVSKMAITISEGGKTIYYKEKDISPTLIKDNIWRKHTFAIKIPEKFINSAIKDKKSYIISAFISYFDRHDYIYVDDINVEFF